jgi:hypothetical protein
MSEFNGEHSSATNGTRTTLVVFAVAIIIVVGLFMVYSHFPSANAAKGTFSDFTTPIATPNNLISSVAVNRSVTLNGLQLTITTVQQATSFSNASNHSGRYTLRVYLNTHDPGQEPADVDFVNRMRVVLPDGQAIGPQVLSIYPLTLPKASQTGFIDFPLPSKVSMSNTVIRFDSNTYVPLTAK